MLSTLADKQTAFTDRQNNLSDSQNISDNKEIIATDKLSNLTDKKSTNDKQQEPLLEKFFVNMLKDIYWAEQHLVKSLPKMMLAATTEELKDAFEDHLYLTQKHVTRLEKVFNLIGKKAEGKKCEAMEGLVKEAESIIAETKTGTMTRDAALIIAAQKVEHYEIATYGGLVQLAITMGLNKVADILDKTLMEEEKTDRDLTDIAESSINLKADKEENYSWKKADLKNEKQGEVKLQLNRKNQKGEDESLEMK
ncbi:MAG: ferritin-like domain-containing protein [Bacteroidia bacterium]|nr:ferritin-like domain-containing protein [Bacteroidia bacterium]